MQPEISSAPMGPSVLNVRILKRLTTDHRVFELDVSFSIAPGITILFGASGAGKTTLLNCIAGIVAPDEGHVVLGNRALFDFRNKINIPARKRAIGYVFQDLALFPHMTAQQNIEYGIRRMRSRQKKHAMEQILAAFPAIAGLLARKPEQISGGERQRVALARALITDPCMLLLDEPLAAMDVPAKSQIMEELRAWNAHHKIPVLYVTHNRDEVFTLGGQVLVLDQGRNVALGPPHSVMRAPRVARIAQLAGFENIFDATVLALHESRGTMTCRISGSQVDLETPIVGAEPGEKLRIGISAGDILLAAFPPAGLSAQNILAGKLVALDQRDVILAATVDAGIPIVANLTLAARDTLQLRHGMQIWVVVKTHSCHPMAQ